MNPALEYTRAFTSTAHVIWPHIAGGSVSPDSLRHVRGKCEEVQVGVQLPHVGQPLDVPVVDEGDDGLGLGAPYEPGRVWPGQQVGLGAGEAPRE